jgi:hypothetical protein
MSRTRMAFITVAGALWFTNLGLAQYGLLTATFEPVKDTFVRYDS